MIKSFEFKDINGISGTIMERLGKEVVITGPNGSGKTRLLEILSSKSDEVINKREIKYSTGESHILSDFTPSKTVYEKPINRNKIDLDSFIKDFIENRDCENTLTRIYESYSGIIEVLDKKELKKLNELLCKTGFDGFTHKSGEERKDPVYDKDGKRYLFKFNIIEEDPKLSDGQKVILVHCIHIVLLGDDSQRRKRLELDKVDYIFIMDEPEIHLHPRSMIALKGLIGEYFKNAQLWIATHSLPLVSTSDVDDIWYMENNYGNSSISRLSKNSEKLIDGLIGEETGRSKLSSLLCWPPLYTMYSYAIECLGSPRKNTDIASETAFAKNVLGTGRTFLDFGSGECRLIGALKDISDENPRIIEGYHAYDPWLNDESEERAKETVRSILGKPDRFTKDISKYKRKSFDFVFLFNVLHEIEFCKIKGELQHIFDLLKDDGYMVIFESKVLRHGEKANKNGFLVLTTAAAKVMFGEIEIVPEGENVDGRLGMKDRFGIIAYKVQKSKLLDIQDREAVEKVMEESKSEIEKLRRGSIQDLGVDKKFEKGIEYAFWTQQFVNSTFILNELGKDTHV